MSSLSFTKLFSSITDSSVWNETSDVRIVWVTMLAMADPLGRVHAAIPGLARRSNVSMEATQQALDVFLSPDTYSRSKDHDGRRIEEIPGGWRLLNYKKHREMEDEEARKEKNRIYQERSRSKRESNTPSDKNLTVSKKPDSQDVSGKNLTVSNVRESKILSAQEEGEVKEEEERSKAKTALVERAFVSYCTVFKKNPKTYTLTPERKKKALLRLEERLAIHGGDLEAVSAEFKRAISNLNASEFHATKGYTDWTEQIFRSTEEFEKRINWQKSIDGQGKPQAMTTPQDDVLAQIRERDRKALEEVQRGYSS